ncbi:MAG TPA: CoA-binding protein [Candidatus Krumholzibacteria bacterium]|nr:CoA-binding protein [Candidatus Krumholzibacteria bacterium]HRX51175.1 CoA-binding protein [Candidatus Krumholzibacteria bacterium]
MGHDIGPVSPGPELDAVILRVLQGMRRIAVVGISDNPERASHGIARFLAGQGFEVVGVNPVLDAFPGVKIYPSLADIPGTVDVVDVFRRSDAVPGIVDAAIARGDGAVWLQEGVSHPEAEDRARAAGLDVVADRCIYKDWLRLMNA